MTEWFEANTAFAFWAASGAVAALTIAALVLLVLWRRAQRSRNTETAERNDAERAAIELELSLREQLGRLRIVREIHDVAISSVTDIISQADGARFAASTDPAAAGRAAASIADTARTALADLRRVNNVVSSGEAAARPEPRMRSARDLLRVMNEAGLVISAEEHGEQFEVTRGAETAIHSLLQEAFSNALKYGGVGTEVRLALHWRGDGLHISVDDDGVRNRARLAGVDPGAPDTEQSYTIEDDATALTRDVTGPGITEMRERVALFGGVFTAHPVPGVGFHVSAVFPALRFDNGVHGVNLARS
ncbi:MAG TPA: histidine kinase [Terrimesophilobacter sp.]|nr:histidine kinase [Terrimesophilobacter sp.]